MKQTGAKFYTRRDKCPWEVREILDFLMKEAERAGPAVDQVQQFDAKGEGITYSTAGRSFCRFDPKHQERCVWAWISGADPAALEASGYVPTRKGRNPWVKVKDMNGRKATGARDPTRLRSVRSLSSLRDSTRD